jgi:hypothetical protein
LLPSLLLKLLVTPALIAAATLIGRRWGETMSGWLVGLPLTSGPVVLFLALDHGAQFAASAAVGVILGTASQAAVALAYGWLVRRRDEWTLAAGGGTIAFALATVGFQAVSIGWLAATLLVGIILMLAIRLMPAFRQAPGNRLRPPRYDLPLRMLFATVLLLVLTAIAPAIGARLTGLLSPFPLYAGILALFAHRVGGPAAAVGVWRGLLFGLFSFVAFFSVIAAGLPRLGIAWGFSLAVLAAALTQGTSLLVLRSRR